MPVIAMLVVIWMFSGVVAAADDEWVGASTFDNDIGVRFGYGEDDGNVVGIDANLQMPFYTVFSIGFNRSGDNDYDSQTVALASDPYETWSVKLGYEQSNHDNVLETSDVELSVFYFSGDWLLELGYHEGELESFYSAALFQRDVVEEQSVVTERHGYRIGVYFFGERWNYSLLLQDMVYDRDLQSLPRRRLVQRLLGEQTMSELLALNDWRADISMGYRWHDTKTHWGINRSQSIVDGEIENVFYLSVDHPLTSQVDGAILLARASNDSGNYAELSLRYSW